MKRNLFPQKPFSALILSSLCFAAFAPSLGAKSHSWFPQDQATYRKRLQKTLAKDFIKKGGWILDFDEARARAKKEGKLIFAYFTRSYAP